MIWESAGSIYGHNIYRSINGDYAFEKEDGYFRPLTEEEMKMVGVNNAEKIETAKELIRKILPDVNTDAAITLTTVLSLLDDVA